MARKASEKVTEARTMLRLLRFLKDFNHGCLELCVTLISQYIATHSHDKKCPIYRFPYLFIATSSLHKTKITCNDETLSTEPRKGVKCLFCVIVSENQ